MAQDPGAEPIVPGGTLDASDGAMVTPSTRDVPSETEPPVGTYTSCMRLPQKPGFVAEPGLHRVVHVHYTQYVSLTCAR